MAKSCLASKLTWARGLTSSVQFRKHSSWTQVPRFLLFSFEFKSSRWDLNLRLEGPGNACITLSEAFQDSPLPVEFQVDDNGKIHRLRRECPSEECGAGIFMAAHFDRQYCGKCGLTYMYNPVEEKWFCRVLCVVPSCWKRWKYRRSIRQTFLVFRLKVALNWSTTSLEVWC